MMMNDNGTWELVEHYLEPIKSLFELDGVTEISINRFDDIWVERFGKGERITDVSFESEQYVSTMVHQIAVALGQPVDEKTHPVLDARLKDGTRVCAPLYPVSTRGTCLSLRVHPKKELTVNDLLSYESFTEEMLDFMKMAIICHYNILVSGSTGSGKTTVLNVLSEFIPKDDRVITVEDTRELKVTVPNQVNLEAPIKRKKEDSQTVDMAFLIKTCLRKNPTRIMVGEIRDTSAATAFLHAINTGHTSCSTIHANSEYDALERIQVLVAGGGKLPFQVVEAQVRSNLNLIIHARNTPKHGRRLVGIAEVQNKEVVPIYRWDYEQGKHIRTDAHSQLSDRYKEYV